MARKLLLSILFLIKATSFAYSQSEELKDVFNNLAFYNQKHDLKYLGEAKKAIDKTIQTRKDSVNLYKGVYKAVVYSTICYADSLNTLKMPDNFLTTTNVYADTLAKRKKIFNYAAEMAYIKKNLANVYIRRGFNDMKRENFRSALDNFQKAKAIAPTTDHLEIYMAYAVNRLGELNKSAEYYDELLQRGKAEPEVFLTAEKTYKILGDTAKALKVIKSGRVIYPENKQLLFEEANIYNNKKDFTALRGLIPDLVKADPENYNVNFLAGICYDKLNQTNKAESFYKKAMQLNGKSYDPVFNLGVLYMKKGVEDESKSVEYFELARTYLEKANEMNPNYPEFLKTLKLLYDKIGNIAQADIINTKLNQIIN